MFEDEFSWFHEIDIYHLRSIVDEGFAFEEEESSVFRDEFFLTTEGIVIGWWSVRFTERDGITGECQWQREEIESGYSTALSLANTSLFSMVIGEEYIGDPSPSIIASPCGILDLWPERRIFAGCSMRCITLECTRYERKHKEKKEKKWSHERES